MDLHALKDAVLGRARARSAASALVLSLVHVLSLVLAACSPPPPAASPDGASEPVAPPAHHALLPLPDGYVIRYRVWLEGASEPEQVIFQVERDGPARVALRSGSSVQRLEFVSDGVRVLTGGYLLRTPLEEGAEWQGPVGSVRVTATSQTLDVGAGHFTGCLETTEVAGQGAEARSIITSYCPGVGIAAIRVESDGRRERFELDSFGPRVDIDAM